MKISLTEKKGNRASCLGAWLAGLVLLASSPAWGLPMAIDGMGQGDNLGAPAGLTNTRTVSHWATAPKNLKHLLCETGPGSRLDNTVHFLDDAWQTAPSEITVAQPLTGLLVPTWDAVDGDFESCDIKDAPPNEFPIPEPETILLFGTGLVGFAGIFRKFLV